MHYSLKRMDRTPGFTLVEVLVAVLIFSIIVGAVYSAFFVSHRAVRSTEDTLVRLHELRNAMQVLKREIEAAVKPDSGEDGTIAIRDRDIFGASASELEIVSFGTPSSGAADVWYELEAEDETEGPLRLIKTLRRPWDPEEEPGMEAVFVEELRSFSVEAGASSSGGDWQRTWSESRLPARVRITLVAEVGGRTVELTETVTPMAERNL